MIEKLEKLVGNTYLYENKHIKIQKVKKINASYVVITNKRTFNFYEAEAYKFIQEIQQVNEFKTLPKMVQSENPTQELEIKSQEGVHQVLLDTLAKVKKDKAYIPQANAICNIASQLINIQKLELQMLSKVKK
jgi:hypothetical protein